MATGTAEHIDATTADAYIGEIWSMTTLNAREAKLVFANLVNRQFEDDLTFGDTIHVGGITNLASQTKDRSANAATIFETVTESNTNITVSTWQYSAVAIETATKVQTTMDLMAKYAPKQGFALALAIDDVLAGLVDDFSTSVGALLAALQYTDITEARQNLDDANAPMEDRHLVVSPKAEREFMNIDHYVHRDYDILHPDQRDGAAERGFLGSWLEFGVWKSTNVEGSNAAGHDNGAFQREARALVVQMNPTTHLQFDINYLANKAVVEQLYGSAEMRDDHGVYLPGP